MAHSKSASKRIRQNRIRRLRNRRRKAKVKDSVRAFDDAVTAGQADEAAQRLREAHKQIDQVAAKGTIHKNTAARKKSRLARRLAAISGQQAPGS